MRLTGHRSVHLASKAVPVKDEGANLFRDSACESGNRLAVQYQILAGTQVAPIVVREDQIAFLGSLFADAPSPLACIAGCDPEFIGVENPADVREYVGSQLDAGTFSPDGRHRFLSRDANEAALGQAASQIFSDGPRERRWKCIPDLPVRRCFPAGKMPIVWEALQARDHANG